MSKQQSSRLKRLVLVYLVFSGLVAHLSLAGAVYWHYRQSGEPYDLYLYEVSNKLLERRQPLALIGAAIQILFFRTGLIEDPKIMYARDIEFELPRWKGLGASALRRDTRPRYGSTGQPVSLDMPDLWSLRSVSPKASVTVDSVAALREAVRQAKPGTQIVLAPGRYRLSGNLQLRAAREGNANEPIVLRGSSIDSVVVETDQTNPVVVEGPYWVISDLVVRGRCAAGPCLSFIDAREGANALTVRNVFATGYEQLITGKPDTSGLRRVADGITLIGARIADPDDGWHLASNRVLAPTTGGRRYHRVCPQPDPGSTLCDSSNLHDSLASAPPYGLVLLRAGRYRQGASIDTPGLHIVAEPGAVLFGTAVNGKGALVTNADVKLEGLECTQIKVPDGNGACVRQQRGDLTLIGVHFHHAQMGMLTGHKGGVIKVYDSYFHDSGYDRGGALGHNVYVNSGSLQFVRSWSVAARNEGHELKSRAGKTEIRDAFLASLNAADSRLVDAPSGGILSIEDSLLAEGPRSSNWQLIAYGLEIGDGNRLPHSDNRILIRGNTIYSDRPRGSRLLKAKHADNVVVSGNVLIGVGQKWEHNTYFEDRSEVGIGGYPRYLRLNTP